MKRLIKICVLLCCLFGFLTGCQEMPEWAGKFKLSGTVSFDEIPEYSKEPYVVLNENRPEFSKRALTTKAYEWYSPLDPLRRCGAVEACIGREIMPEEERGPIGQVKPAGWHTVKYEGIDGMFLYNRCHLIGYQLTGENANERNLITGTRYMNVEGMLPFENMIADYVKDTGNHVMYRVRPVYEGMDLLCRGLQMEAYSVEDDGEGISFHVFVYNVQPGIEIDYATGESRSLSGEEGISTSGDKDDDRSFLSSFDYKEICKLIVYLWKKL